MRNRVNGIDVSKHQALVNSFTPKVNDGVFAYHRASIGLEPDAVFERNYQTSLEAKVYRGGYHFLTANQDIRSQIDLFANIMEDNGVMNIAPAIDIEQKETTVYQAMQAMELTAEAFNVKPVIYLNYDMINRVGGTWMNAYDIWLSNPRYVSITLSQAKWFGELLTYEPKMPAGINAPKIFQFSWKGDVDKAGVNDPRMTAAEYIKLYGDISPKFRGVDLNYFMGTMSAFKEWALVDVDVPVEPPEPPVPPSECEGVPKAIEALEIAQKAIDEALVALRG